MVVMLIPAFAQFSPMTDMILNLVGVALFIAASLTDMLDGKIARKQGLVTDFGKFLDPLADKFMVIGAMLCIFYVNSTKGNANLATLYIFALIVVIFRELAVTSIRLVASSSGGVVIAANYLGKVKTCVQIAFILIAIIEPMFDYDFLGGHAFSYLTMAAMIVMTLWSGYEYFKGYWKYINPSV